MNQRLGRQGRLLGWMYGEDGIPWGSEPDAYDPAAVRGSLDRVGSLFGEGRYFPLRAHGLDQVPATPVMLVGNHSGGTSIPDAWGLLYLWYRRFGVDRPIHPMAHDMVFSNRVTGEYFAKRGALRANRELATAVLRDRRRDLLVYPGGDLDCWRPYSERYAVRFDGRRGYARMAIRAGVPIVPVAHAGAHHTLVVLTDGERLARVLHIRDLVRARIFPIHVSLPFGLTIGPLPHVPTPTLLRYRFGPPIPPPRVRPGREDEAVEELDARVRAAMQRELDVLAAERLAPLERLADLGRAARSSLIDEVRARTP